MHGEVTQDATPIMCGVVLAVLIDAMRSRLPSANQWEYQWWELH
jgi:hypothetical protein